MDPRWTHDGHNGGHSMDTAKTRRNVCHLRHLFSSVIICPRPRAKCRVSTVSIVCPSLCPSCVRRVSTKCPPCAQNLRLPIQMARSRVGLGRLKLRSHTQQTRFPKKWREFAYFLYISIPLLSVPKGPPDTIGSISSY